MKWRTAEFLNSRNTEEILSERGGSMKLGEFSETANRDACRMEHAISEESYLKIQ
jgi:Mn-dependent DtxR family transcriptional regulator